MAKSSVWFGKISLFAVILLAACSPTATLVSTVAPTIEEKPVETNTPLPTIFPTATITFAPTRTVTVNPTRDISDLSVLGAGPSNGMYLLNFNIPGLDQVYMLTVDGIPFKCQILPEFGDRLSCAGPMQPWGKNVSMEFFDPSTGGKLYQIAYTLPAFDYEFGKATEPPCVNPVACADRGKNYWCETEIHQNEHGYCMVATCFDACGFCVGIDTCQNP